MVSSYYKNKRWRLVSSFLTKKYILWYHWSPLWLKFNQARISGAHGMKFKFLPLDLSLQRTRQSQQNSWIFLGTDPWLIRISDLSNTHNNDDLYLLRRLRLFPQYNDNFLTFKNVTPWTLLLTQVISSTNKESSLMFLMNNFLVKIPLLNTQLETQVSKHSGHLQWKERKQIKLST